MMRFVAPLGFVLAAGVWLFLAVAQAAVADIEGERQGWALFGPLLLTLVGVALLGVAAWWGPRGHPREASVAVVASVAAFAMWVALIS